VKDREHQMLVDIISSLTSVLLATSVLAFFTTLFVGLVFICLLSCVSILVTFCSSGFGFDEKAKTDVANKTEVKLEIDGNKAE
jgi:hypothetical protein